MKRTMGPGHLVSDFPFFLDTRFAVSLYSLANKGHLLFIRNRLGETVNAGF